MILFYFSTAAFLASRSLLFPWWLVSVGGLGGICITSDIKNYLTLGLKLLNNVAEISNSNPTSCRSASTLKRKRV